MRVWSGRNNRQIVPNYVKIDPFRSVPSDINTLARTGKRVLNQKRILRAKQLALPIPEIAPCILIEIDPVVLATVNRQVANTAAGRVARLKSAVAEQILRPQIGIPRI